MIRSGEFKPISSWGISDDRPFIIAGPCGAESEIQLLETAKQLANNNRIHLFRAGVWKPRTRPGVFEGVGEVALEWLKTVKQETGLPVSIEVAHPKHVEKALKADIDVLWIGARTSVNPFQVQELADTLKGVDVPVMVKNPVNPDIELWIGTMERFMNAGVKRIAAIHRGFSSYENSSYRNKPNWEIPIELKRRFPEVSLICDPSHICGSVEPLNYISQFAMDLNYDGLMIESHFDPNSALSDAKQQVTPQALNALLDNLILRDLKVDDVIILSKLEDLRDQIDEVDDQIIKTLANRMNIARNIGDYKRLNNVTILQPERWDEILDTRTHNGIQNKLTKEFILRLYSLIHEESIHQQTKMMQKEINELKGSE